MGGETEDDLFLPTFVKVGEFLLNDARGPKRCRRRGPGLRHASRGIDVFFSKENEKFSADAPQLQEDSVEAVQSLLPQERGLDVAEQRVDARMPQRSTAMAAVTKAMESDPEARQVSKRVWCGRSPSLRPVQFCWSFFGSSVAA